VHLIFLASNSAVGFFTTGSIQVSFFLNDYIHVINSAIFILYKLLRQLSRCWWNISWRAESRIQYVL